MSDVEKNDGGLTRREFAKTVAAGVAAVAAAHSLSALQAHAAQSAPQAPAASGNQEERDLCNELSAFAARTKWEDLPPNVVHDTKMLFLDSVGNALAGGSCVPGKMIINLAQRLGGSPESSIIGGRGKVSPSSAVLANGQLINQLDYDAMPGGHTPPYVIPPALALAESAGASGKALIVAMAVGYEIAARVGSAVSGGPGFDADGNVKWAQRSGEASIAFGASAGAGKILNLDEKKMANALGVASHLSQVPTWIRYTFAEHRAMSKYGVPGWQNTGSLMAALLAEMGYIGDVTLFDDPEQGFWKFAGYDGWHPSKVLNGIGTEWTCFRHVPYKAFPCCSMFQNEMVLFLRILEQNKIAPGDIESVKVLGHPTLDAPAFANRELNSVVDIQFGPANALSLAANGVAPGADWGNLDIVRSPKIQDLAKKITYSGTPHFGKNPVHSVEVVAKGQTFKEEITTPGILTEKQFTDADVIAKFQHNASGVLPRAKVEQAQKAIVDLENVTNTAEMMKSVTL